MTPEEYKKQWQRYTKLKQDIQAATSIVSTETEEQREKRKKELLGSFPKFCAYYFERYLKAPFAYFHKAAAKKITESDNIFAVLEWPREHAKSVIADIMLPMFLLARGELTGGVIASANLAKAKGLLLDLQAELEANERFNADFGKQQGLGSWSDGHFVTADGIGFWAFGRGQSPRGIRVGEKRPNYCVVDDVDDDEIVKNEARVIEAKAWVLGALYFAFDTKGCRFVVAGNRIHKKSILAHIVGDVEEDDPINPEIWHSKVYALENPKTHREDQSVDGVPAWKENYTVAQIRRKMAIAGYSVSQKEFFHKHVVEGKVFKKEWIRFGKPPKEFDYVVTYNDPSFKDTAKNDYKAIICVGKAGTRYWILRAWVAQATTSAMVRAHYDIADSLEEEGILAQHFFEANFIQDTHIDAYEEEGENRGHQLSIRKDKRKKPDKSGRIEAMTPLFERGFVWVDERLRKDLGYQTFEIQLLSFPTGHDDGPDALEGAIWMSKDKTNPKKRETSFGVRKQERGW